MEGIRSDFGDRAALKATRDGLKARISNEMELG
jgi:hypothetical protein